MAGQDMMAWSIVGYDKHVRINKQKSFTNGRAHINGIEAFWKLYETTPGQVQRRQNQFRTPPQRVRMALQ
jgi:hypothetical protein